MAVTDRALGLTGGIAIKAPVLVASTGNLTLESSQTIDGILVSTGDRVLVWVQNSTSENGVYVVDGSTWARAKDFDGKNDVVRHTLVYISTGTEYGGKFFAVTSTGDNVPGTDNITFANTGSLTVPSSISVSSYMNTFLGLSTGTTARDYLGAGAAGDAVFTATSTAAARTALGLGTAAVENMGTSSTGVPSLATVNQWTAAQIGVPVALSVNSTGGLAVGLSTANIFTHTLSTATVLLTPTAGVAGQWFTISLLQGSSTNYALTYSSDYRFGGGSTGSTAPAINTTTGSRAVLTCFMPTTGYVMATLTNYGI